MRFGARSVITVVCAVIIFSAAGCSGSRNSSGTASPAASPAHTALPGAAVTPITFQFSDVAVASGGASTLRLGFTMTNGSKDPQLCDVSEFSVQLSDGTVISADGSAENSCDPDTVDPRGTGNVTMYFDLPHSYTGDVTLFMVVDDKVVGQGTATLK